MNEASDRASAGGLFIAGGTASKNFYADKSRYPQNTQIEPD